MKVLVCGGRNFGDYMLLASVLNKLHAAHQISQIIEGGASGADTHAKVWAKSRSIRGREFRANWNKYGKAAGPIRNQRMIDVGKPDLVVAFPGGRGTADMVSRAQAARVTVMTVTPP